MKPCSAEFHIDMQSATTAYRRGCRGDACREAHAERTRKWRRDLQGTESSSRITGGEPPLEAITVSEWAKGRGYDPATRTYAGAAS